MLTKTAHYRTIPAVVGRPARPYSRRCPAPAPDPYRVCGRLYKLSWPIGLPKIVGDTLMQPRMWKYLFVDQDGEPMQIAIDLTDPWILARKGLSGSVTTGSPYAPSNFTLLWSVPICVKVTP